MSLEWFILDEFEDETGWAERPIAGPFLSVEEARDAMKQADYPYVFPYGPSTVIGETFIGDDPNYGYRELLRNASRTQRGMQMRTEAELLTAMAKATSLDEQRRLMADLEALRQDKSERVATSRELDLADTFIRDTLTPVRVHEHHTAATDWITEVETNASEYDHAQRVAATQWYNNLHPEVRRYRSELKAQAEGMARRTAGQYGESAEAAYRAFMDTVARLLRLADDKPGQVDEDQSGNAESTVTDYDTDADQEPWLAEDWEDDGDTGHHPEMPGAEGRRNPKGRAARRRIAVHLTNVGLDGDNGVGTDPSGNRVKFKLSAEDREALSTVLFSDLSVNFSGVDVDQADIISEGSRRTATDDFGATHLCEFCEEPIYKEENGLWVSAEEGGTYDWCDENGEDGHKPGQKVARRRTAAEGQTCDVCGDKIAQTDGDWHHDNGEKHDHEAKPSSSDSKESRRKTAGYYTLDGLDSTEYKSEAEAVRAAMEIDPGSEVLYNTADGEENLGPAYMLAREIEIDFDEFDDRNDFESKRRTAGVYCKTHQVWVGDGNADTHSRDSCVKEQRKTDKTKESRRRVAAEGQTCEVCGDSIERDPENEDPQTWHHNNGESHDHEAKPSSDSKESRRRTAESGKWVAEVTGINESRWSRNGLVFDTREEAERWLANLSMNWFGYDMGRVVPADTPKNETIQDTGTDGIYQNFRSGSRRTAAQGVQIRPVNPDNFNEPPMCFAGHASPGEIFEVWAGVGEDYEELYACPDHVGDAAGNLAKMSRRRTAAAIPEGASGTCKWCGVPVLYNTYDDGSGGWHAYANAPGPLFDCYDNPNGTNHLLPGGGHQIEEPAFTVDEGPFDVNFGRNQNYEARKQGTGRGAVRKTAEHRPIYEIAAEIKREWGGKVNFAARPYLDAMMYLNSITDMYGADDAGMVVAYFLSNASSFRGEKAKALKAELKAMLGRKGSKSANEQSGHAESSEDQVEVGDEDDVPMWPWEIGEEPSTGDGAADVADVHTPGQSVADYPTANKTQAFRNRVQTNLRKVKA